MRGWKGESTASGRGLALGLGERARLRVRCGHHSTPSAAQRHPLARGLGDAAQELSMGRACWEKGKGQVLGRRRSFLEGEAGILVSIGTGEGIVSGSGPYRAPSAPGQDWFLGGGGASGRGARRLPVICVCGLRSVRGSEREAILSASCRSAASSGARFSRTTLSRVQSVTFWEGRGARAHISGGVAALGW